MTHGGPDLTFSDSAIVGNHDADRTPISGVVCLDRIACQTSEIYIRQCSFAVNLETALFTYQVDFLLKDVKAKRPSTWPGFIVGPSVFNNGEIDVFPYFVKESILHCYRFVSSFQVPTVRIGRVWIDLAYDV